MGRRQRQGETEGTNEKQEMTKFGNIPLYIYSLADR